MKKMPLLALLLAGMAAQAEAKSLVMVLSDSTKIYYLMGGEVSPTVRLVDGEVYVNADRYAFAQVDRFYISATDDPVLAIGGPRAEQLQMRDGVFLLSGAAAARLYDTAGRLVRQIAAASDVATTAVDTRELPAGTYILQVGEQSVKFLKH